MMTPDEYDRWWLSHTDADGEAFPDLPEDVRTLAAHVLALRGRIDRLPQPDESEMNEWAQQCACAYDHPRDLCSVHHKDVT